MLQSRLRTCSQAFEVEVFILSLLCSFQCSVLLLWRVSWWWKSRLQTTGCQCPRPPWHLAPAPSMSYGKLSGILTIALIHQCKLWVPLLRAVHSGTVYNWSHYFWKVWGWNPPLLHFKHWAHAHDLFFPSFIGVRYFIKWP